MRGTWYVLRVTGCGLRGTWYGVRGASYELRGAGYVSCPEIGLHLNQEKL